MRLVRYKQGDGAALGVVRDDAIVDLAQCGLRYSRMIDVIEGGDRALSEIRDGVAKSATHLFLSEAKLLAPIERPSKYLAIGMNFAKHIEEAKRLGVDEPKKQFWFNKQTSCLTGPFDDIDPGVSEQVDYEVELGVIIGREAKAVKAADALDYVFGYTIANDISARDWQFHSPTFTMGKSFDTHGPIGPWIVTKDEIPDPQMLELHCWVNGEQRQSSNTALMIHTVADQIEYLSTAFTLYPGDLLATGTPEGVGVGMDPQRFLSPGDVVRCAIDNIGHIENRVVRPAG